MSTNQNSISDDWGIYSMIGESTTIPWSTARAKINPATGALLIESTNWGTWGLTIADVTTAIDDSTVPTKLDTLIAAVEAQSWVQSKVDQRIHTLIETVLAPFTIDYLTMKNVTISCEITTAWTWLVYIKLKDDTWSIIDYVLKEGNSFPINCNYNVDCYVSNAVSDRAFVFFNL